MPLPLPRPDQVPDLITVRDEELRDQTAVAAPPKRLGAHQTRRGLRERCVKRLLPLRAPHPGRVVPEAGASDAPEPFRTGLAASPPAELDGVPVPEAGLTQRLGKRRAVELGVPARAGKAADIDESPDTSLQQALEELFGASSAVADRKHPHPSLG